jgi:xanthine/CO dehydrogenase XdhC/CoxF family maturation factor
MKAFHCPIGIEIGTNHPYEIAVSAIAQLIQTRDALRLERSRQAAPDSSPL